MAKVSAASGVLFTDRRRFNLNRVDDIAYKYPALNPFLAWTTELSDQETDDPDFKMFEDKSSWRYQRFVLNDASPNAWSGSATPGETATNAVDGGVNVAIDSSLIGLQVQIWNSDKTTSKGLALVTDVSGANVTFKAIGNPASATEVMGALADNDIFEVITSNFGERSYSPDSFEDELRLVYNSCGISRTPVEISKSLEKMFLQGGSKQRERASTELTRLREVAMKRHKLHIEKKLLLSWRSGGIGGTAYSAGSGADTFSAAHITDKDGRVVRSTAGYIPIMLRYGRTSGDYQNVFTFTKSKAKQYDFDQATDKMAQYVAEPDGTLPVFCGPQAFMFLSGPAVAKNSGFHLHQAQMDEKLGFRFRYLETGNATLKLIPLPSLRGTGYDNFALIPNRDGVHRKYFRPDTYNTNIKTDNGYDGIKDEFFSDDGLCLTQADAHGLIKVV